jgi:hypothetical protein
VNGKCQCGPEDQAVCECYPDLRPSYCKVQSVTVPVTQLSRIERKLDALLRALAEDDELPTETLEGLTVPEVEKGRQSL